MVIKRSFVVIVTSIFVISCSGGSDNSSVAVTPCSGANKNVTVSWAANKEAAVNTTGGGYKVYHSRTSGFLAGDTGVTVVDVPYSSGSASPTSTTLSLVSAECSHFIRVTGYSALNGGTTSDLSPQTIVTVP